MTFARIAIVNRGESALRLIHAVREVNAETGSEIETVALFTDDERTATFVREADLAYPLGPASDRPYLDHAVLGTLAAQEHPPVPVDQLRVEADTAVRADRPGRRGQGVARRHARSIPTM